MRYQADNIVNTSNKGRVFCNKNILLSIINLAAKEISGVSKLNKTFAGKLSKLFSSNVYEGVKIAYANGGITINVYLNVYYGNAVSDTVYRVQENIKNAVLAMMDVKINAINVHVMGVDIPVQE